MISCSKAMAEKPQAPGWYEARTSQIHWWGFLLSYGILSSRNTSNGAFHQGRAGFWDKLQRKWIDLGWVNRGGRVQLGLKVWIAVTIVSELECNRNLKEGQIVSWIRRVSMGLEPGNQNIMPGILTATSLCFSILVCFLLSFPWKLSSLLSPLFKLRLPLDPKFSCHSSSQRAYQDFGSQFLMWRNKPWLASLWSVVCPWTNQVRAGRWGKHIC